MEKEEDRVLDVTSRRLNCDLKDADSWRSSYIVTL